MNLTLFFPTNKQKDIAAKYWKKIILSLDFILYFLKTTDTINRFFGKDTVKLAVMGSGNEWKLRQEKLSGRYTTNWKEIIQVQSSEYKNIFRKP